MFCVLNIPHCCIFVGLCYLMEVNSKLNYNDNQQYQIESVR